MNLASLSDKSSRSLGALGFGLNKMRFKVSTGIVVLSEISAILARKEKCSRFS